MLQGVLWSTKPTKMSFISDCEICVVRLQQLSDFCWSWTDDHYEQYLSAGMNRLTRLVMNVSEYKAIWTRMRRIITLNLHTNSACWPYLYTHMAGNRKPYCLCNKMPAGCFICASSRDMYHTQCMYSWMNVRDNAPESRIILSNQLGCPPYQYKSLQPMSLLAITKGLSYLQT